MSDRPEPSGARSRGSVELRHAPGDRVGPWILDAPLGRGGFSEVWRAHDEPAPALEDPLLADPELRGEARRSRPSRTVALKLLVHPEHAGELRKDAQTLGLVSGEGIVRTLEANLDHDPPYLALALMPGGDLRTRLRHGASPSAALRLFERILTIMVRVHREGVVHGDLKPENILFDASGEVAVADFGLSRRISQKTATLSVSLSLADARLAGTLDYMAPEQRDGAKPTRASDVYALGVVLHELLLGTRPQGLAARASARAPGLPPVVDRLLERTLAADPGDRFEDAGAVLRSLRAGLWNDATALRARAQGLGERSVLAVGWPVLWGLASGALGVVALLEARNGSTTFHHPSDLFLSALATGLPVAGMAPLFRAGRALAGELRTIEQTLETLKDWREKPPEAEPPRKAEPSREKAEAPPPRGAGFKLLVVALAALVVATAFVLVDAIGGFHIFVTRATGLRRNTAPSPAPATAPQGSVAVPAPTGSGSR